MVSKGIATYLVPWAKVPPSGKRGNMRSLPEAMHETLASQNKAFEAGFPVAKVTGTPGIGTEKREGPTAHKMTARRDSNAVCACDGEEDD